MNALRETFVREWEEKEEGDHIYGYEEIGCMMAVGCWGAGICLVPLDGPRKAWRSRRVAEALTSVGAAAHN